MCFWNEIWTGILDHQGYRKKETRYVILNDIYICFIPWVLLPHKSNLCSMFQKIIGLSILKLWITIGMYNISLLHYFTDVLFSKFISKIFHDFHILKIELCCKKSGPKWQLLLFFQSYLKIHIAKTATCCTRTNNFQNIFFVCILDCKFRQKRVPLLCNITNYSTRRGLDF